jgi:hypothetical protein
MGSHQVLPGACTSPDGTLHTDCHTCLDGQRQRSAAHARAAAIDQNAEQDAIDEQDGVAMEAILDDVVVALGCIVLVRVTSPHKGTVRTCESCRSSRLARVHTFTSSVKRPVLLASDGAQSVLTR